MRFIYHDHEKSAGIYRITCLVNGWFYIGETTSFIERDHLGPLRRGTHKNHRLLADFRRYGKDAFVFEVQEVVENHRTRKEREVALIREVFGEGCYNLVIEGPPSPLGKKGRKGHRSSLGLRRSPEEKARRKAACAEPAMREVLLKNLAKAHLCVTPESREKARVSNSGKKRSPEAIENIRQALLRPQTREKNRQNHLGKKASMETRERIRIASLKREAIRREREASAGN